MLAEQVQDEGGSDNVDTQDMQQSANKENTNLKNNQWEGPVLHGKPDPMIRDHLFKSKWYELTHA